MKSIREFEVWSIPGQLLHVEYSKNTLQLELWNEGIPRDAFLGISAIPDTTDCRNLELAIEAGETTEDSFRKFCSANNLIPNLQSEESSAKFLEYLRGRCLAWIHLHEGDSVLLARIQKMLTDRGHLIIHPDYASGTIANPEAGSTLSPMV